MELHKNIALDYFSLGKTRKAIDEALKILKLDSKNTWAISKLINFHIKLNEWNEATEYLETFQRINKINDPHKLGLFIIQEGRTLQNNNS